VGSSTEDEVEQVWFQMLLTAAESYLLRLGVPGLERVDISETEGQGCDCLYSG
jgi:hypothetical protein